MRHTRAFSALLMGLVSIGMFHGVACSDNAAVTGTTAPAASTASSSVADSVGTPVAPAPDTAATSDAASSPWDFGNFTSQTLTTKAWDALARSDADAVEAYTGKCIDLYAQRALEQSMSLTDFASKETAFDQWALNDVATSYFIRGKMRTQQGKTDLAKEDFTQIMEHFPFAQAWDAKGWFWKVAEAAKDQLNMLGTSYDFGDYTSQTLVSKAWQALDKKDYKGVELFANKCIQLYEAEALKQQGMLTEYAPKEKAFNYWALNDAGTAYFILGDALEAQARREEAKRAFQKVVEELSFAQCWDPRGWFWKVAVASRGRMNKLAAESMDPSVGITPTTTPAVE